MERGMFDYGDSESLEQRISSRARAGEREKKGLEKKLSEMPGKIEEALDEAEYELVQEDYPPECAPTPSKMADAFRKALKEKGVL